MSLPPEDVCFTILGPIMPGEFIEKSLDVVCKNSRECEKWMNYLEVVVKYFMKNKTIKTNVEIRKNIDPKK